MTLRKNISKNEPKTNDVKNLKKNQKRTMLTFKKQAKNKRRKNSKN